MHNKIHINTKIIKVLCFVIAFVIGFGGTQGQINVYKSFMRTEWQPLSDSLYQNYGTNKKFVKDFELQALIALSYYPELKNVPITFEYSDIRTTMEVRPEFLSALKNHNRRYIIFIDNKVKDNEGVLLNEVSFNAQVGVIGHELAHIMDFQQRSVTSLLGLGIDYVIKKNHAKYERSIDEYAIKRGLGWQELEFADYMQNKSKATVKYKRFKQINYLSSAEIEEEIAKMKLYSSLEPPRLIGNPVMEKQ